MNDLHFRLADDGDLATLVRLRDDAARWMLAKGINGQWQPGELDEDYFRRIMASGEVWLAETADYVAGAWELWWDDEDAWGPQPPVAGYVHRLMVDRSKLNRGRVGACCELRSTAPPWQGERWCVWTAWPTTRA